MLEQLKNWLFPGRPKADEEFRPPPVRVRPPVQRAQRPAVKQNPAVKKTAPDLAFQADIGGRIEDAGPGKNVLIRSKYVREDTGTHEILKIVDESLLDDEQDGGIDPYNTGRFDRSKSWTNRSK